MVGTAEGYVVGLVGLVVVFCGFSCVRRREREGRSTMLHGEPGPEYSFRHPVPQWVVDFPHLRRLGKNDGKE